MEKRLSATEKACDSTMYMAQHSLPPGASFELTHMRFVYSHLAAADRNIRLVYVVYDLLFMTQLFYRNEESLYINLSK